MVAITKRLGDGKPIARDPCCNGVKVKFTLNSYRFVPFHNFIELVSATKSAGRGKRKHKKRLKIRVLQDQVGKCNVVHTLANASSYLSIGWFLCKHADSFRKELRKFYYSVHLSTKVDAAITWFKVKKIILKMRPVRIYKMDCFALLDTTAVLNFISVQLLSLMTIDTSPSWRTTIIGNGINAGCKVVVKDTPVNYMGKIAKVKLLAVDAIPADLLNVLIDLEQ